MDKQLPKKKFYVKYKYPIAGGVVFIALLIYIITTTSGASRLRISEESIRVEEVKKDKFMEYVDVEGVIQPILTIRVNTLEKGTVESISKDEGSMVRQGDTLVILTNPELKREIEDKEDEWAKTLMGYREKELEMEQKSISLKQQALEASFELNRLKKNYELDKEEYQMGVKTKAQLEVSRDNYDYNRKNTAFKLENLSHDSAMTIIRRQMLADDKGREEKKYVRMQRRLDDMLVLAPISGQLSFVKVAPGQLVGAGESIGEIKVMDQFKIHTNLSEYYIDRITTGLPATIIYQKTNYPLKINKVVPEIKDRMFAVDLVFSEQMPENVRIGKNYRVQIELGQPEEAVIIPRGNFFQTTGGQWVFKVNKAGDKAVRQPISIGRQNPQQYEVISGLEEGDRVIVSGYENLGDVQELVLDN